MGQSFLFLFFLTTTILPGSAEGQLNPITLGIYDRREKGKKRKKVVGHQ